MRCPFGGAGVCDIKVTPTLPLKASANASFRYQMCRNWCSDFKLTTSSSGTRRTLFAWTFQKCTSPQLSEPAASTYSKAVTSPGKYSPSQRRLRGSPGRNVGRRCRDSGFVYALLAAVPFSPVIRAFQLRRIGREHTFFRAILDPSALPHRDRKRVGKECRSRWSPDH